MSKSVLFFLVLILSFHFAKSQNDKYTIFAYTKSNISACTKLTDDGITNNAKYLDANTKIRIGGIHVRKGIEIIESFQKSDTLFMFLSDLNVDSASLSRLKGFSKNELDTLKKTTSYSEALIRKKQLDNVLAPIDYSKTYGLSILEWSTYDESEYTEGTSVKFRVYNPTKKTIKYIWFNIVGFNAVDDKIFNKGKSIITLKGVGPIKPSNEASYIFDYVWFTDLVETSKISSIKVQYMDGTIKLIQNPLKITLSTSQLNAINELNN